MSVLEVPVREALTGLLAKRPPTIPGVAVAVIDDGAVTFVCDGITSVEHPLRVTPGTLFALGSVTEILTATTALVLAGRAFDLDSTVEELLPDLRLPPALRSITVDHLLTYRGGWAGDWVLTNIPARRDGFALAHLVAQAPIVPRATRPGGPVNEDYFGWCVLGRLIEVVADLPFREAVDALVCEPLGMRRSVFSAEDAITHRVAAGHVARPDGSGADVVRGREPWADQWSIRRALWPAGGWVGSVEDAVLLLREHLAAAAGQDTTLALGVDPTASRAAAGGLAAVGAGWHLHHRGDTRVAVATGEHQGYTSRTVLVPDRSSGLVVLTNAQHGAAWIDGVVTWYLDGHLRLDPATPALGAFGDDPRRLEGTYRLGASTVRLHGATTNTVTVEATDIGPTWRRQRSWTGRFSTGGSICDSTGEAPEVHHGTDLDARWIRHRGRVHTHEDDT